MGQGGAPERIHNDITRVPLWGDKVKDFLRAKD